MKLTHLTLELMTGFFLLFILVKVLGKKKNRMTINQLQSLLRQSETFSIREVAYCYLEANGDISILKKSPKQKVQQEDLNLPEKPVCIPVTLIRDGELLMNELIELGRNEEWLLLQLQAHGVADFRNVFVAEWLDGDGYSSNPLTKFPLKETHQSLSIEVPTARF